jgi:hypothetical protein
MPTQMQLPVQPARAESINAALAIVPAGDEVALLCLRACRCTYTPRTTRQGYVRPPCR